jgi:hypothetical protein
VFQLETAQGERFALKAYFREPGDPRDRLGAEFAALRFLWDTGLRCVPQPLALDPDAALGLYEFIPGDRPVTPSEAEVGTACAFLVHLRTLCSAPGAQLLPAASEACFSLQAVVENIQLRLDRLTRLESAPASGSGLKAFLSGELVPAWLEILDGCRERCLVQGIPFEEALPPSERTLSPSDFGFHNALRRPGGLVFLDFEYFGWDDPSKTLADFLLHPGMNLTLGQRQSFASGLLRHPWPASLPQRTRLVFPLYGIKWCLILLNEFLPGALDRRTFADIQGRSAEDRQSNQLGKARSKLNQLLDDHAHFPYFSC